MRDAQAARSEGVDEMNEYCEMCRWPVRYDTANSGRNHVTDTDGAVRVYCDDCADTHSILGPMREAEREGARILGIISRHWDVGTGTGRRTHRSTRA